MIAREKSLRIVLELSYTISINFVKKIARIRTFEEVRFFQRNFLYVRNGPLEARGDQFSKQ